jgi:hypothetical protein
MQWGARQERPTGARVPFDFPHEDRVHVFKGMAFIHDHLAPVMLGKMNKVLDGSLL